MTSNVRIEMPHNAPDMRVRVRRFNGSADRPEAATLVDEHTLTDGIESFSCHLWQGNFLVIDELPPAAKQPAAGDAADPPEGALTGDAGQGLDVA
jgi:hypothetical protein